ncbi:MAG: alpha/beta hydrolase [Planctomycetota bacterium]
MAAEEVGDVRAPDGTRLAVRELGSDGPLVIAPALSWLGEDLTPLAQGRRLRCYDVRGQGLSDAVPDTAIGLARDIADLAAVCDAAGEARVTLLGWSYYGAIAARFALAHPERVRALALIAPIAPRAQPHWRGYLTAFGRRVDPAAVRRLEEQRRAGLRARDPKAWCRFYHDLILGVYVADREALRHMRSSPCVAPNLDPEIVNQQMLKVMEALGDYDWREEMRGLATPTAIWHGDRDPVPLAGSHEWVETLAQARLTVLEGCGHMPWLEQPQQFLPMLDAFLSEAAGAG